MEGRVPWLSSLCNGSKASFLVGLGTFLGPIIESLRRSLPIRWPEQWPKAWLCAVYRGLNMIKLPSYIGIIVRHCQDPIWTNQYVRNVNNGFLNVFEGCSPVLSGHLGHLPLVFPGHALLIALLRGSLGTLRGVTLAQAFGGGGCRSDGCHLGSGTHARAISPGVLGSWTLLGELGDVETKSEA